MRTAAIVYIALISVTTLVGLIIVYKLLRRCFKLVTTLSGVEARFVVIALGLASIVFPAVLSYTLKSFLWFGLDVSSRIPEALRTGWYQALKDCSSPVAESDQTLPPRCIIELGLRYLSAFTASVKEAYADSSLYRIQIDQLFYLFALWIAISLCFRQVPVASAQSTGSVHGRPWLGLVYDRLSPASTKNILFFVILGIGSYLSVAAITAIPSFLDKSAPVDQVTRDLSSHLDEIFKEQHEHLDKFPAEPRTNDPFKPLVDDLEKKRIELIKSSGTQTTPATTTRDVISQVDASLVSERYRREKIFKQWTSLRGEAEPHATSDKVAALNAFQLANSGRAGIRETNQHSLALEAWYRTRINSLNSQLNRCRNALLELDGAWQPWVQAQQRVLGSTQEARDNYGNYYPLPDEWVRYASRECTYTEGEYDIPTRATLGSSLGPLRPSREMVGGN